MDLIKKLTGKNPSEYEPIAKSLVDNSDVELFKKLVEQDDFLFDFIKDNVAKRIQKACNKDNYLNLLDFLEIYSPYYDTVIAEIFHEFGKETIYTRMKDLFLNGTNSQRAYAAKYFTFADQNLVRELLPELRVSAQSDYEPLAMNSIEVLSALSDGISKNEAIEKLDSADDFEKYNAVKFLVLFGARDALPKIFDIMKKSGFSENIASEIPYLEPLNELMETDYENAMLVLAHIINSIPEILSPSVTCTYRLKDIFAVLVNKPIDSVSAVVLRMAREKFEELSLNDEYMFDCDKNTKDEVKAVWQILKPLNINRLNSLLYDELYEDSDFVFFAVDYVDEIEELETLLESKNQTLIFKTLSLMKDKGLLDLKHKEIALKNITNPNIKDIVTVM